MLNFISRLPGRNKKSFVNERGASTVEWVGIAAVTVAVVGSIILALHGGAGAQLADAVSSIMSQIAFSFDGTGSTGGSLPGGAPGTGHAGTGQPPYGSHDVFAPVGGVPQAVAANFGEGSDTETGGLGAPGTIPSLENISPQGPYVYKDPSGQWVMYLDPQTNRYMIEGRSLERSVTETRERTVKEYPGWTDFFLFKWAKDRGWLDWTATERTETYTEERTAQFRPTLEGHVGEEHIRLDEIEVEDDTWRVEGDIRNINKGAIIRGKSENGEVLFELDPTLKLGRLPVTDASIPDGGSFGWRWGKMHNGIDLKSSTNTEVHVPIEGKIIRYTKDGTDGFWRLKKDGQEIRAATKAQMDKYVNQGYEVVEAHDNEPGRIIVVDHGMFYDPSQKKFVHVETRYVHVLLNPNFKIGDTIKPDDVLGNYAKIGYSTGPHLHYEVYIDGKPVDPDPDKNPAIYGRERGT